MNNVFRNKFILTNIFMIIITHFAFLIILLTSCNSDIKRQSKIYHDVKYEKNMIIQLQEADLLSNFEILSSDNSLINAFGMNIQKDLGVCVVIDNDLVELYPSKHDTVIFKTIYVVFISLYILGSLLILYSASSKKLCKLFKNNTNDSKMNEKTLSLLSENIHHELKTPLVVISSKLEQLKDVFETLTKEAICIRRRNTDLLLLDTQGCMNGDIDECKSMKDFELVNTHIGVIYNILDRMKDFKNMKRDEGDRTLYDVIDVSFKTLKMFSKNDFSYEIDVILKKFQVDVIGNEDIINIFINHIKNSLEANATTINVHFVGYNGGITSTQIMDNGNGIPTSIQDSVFDTQFSTKELSDGETRGVGLYLSKYTLSAFGGDDFLIESDSRGTSFGIDIPSKRR